ncbi:MAG: DUF2723 domain-containing protein, partial [Cytophagaceae bacterium]
IAYLTGLSIGVHLLNLVVTPVLALIYYYKKYPVPTLRGGLLALGIGLVILGCINASISGLPALAFAVERLFVNSFGMPFNTGVIFFILTVVVAIGYGIIWSIRQQRVGWNTALLAVAFLLIGYTSYLQVLVRANFNPPLNENNPADVLSFRAYQSREQYGSRSLTYGPIFTAEPTGQESDKSKLEPVYMKNKTGYEIFDYKPVYTYEKGDQMLFPRVWSNQQNHPQLYRRWLNLAEGQKPTFGDNLNFFITYQLGHMWARYLMWNFAGRESDIEGAGYLTPFSSNKDLPEVLQNNKGRDNFYMLPLVLALLGIVYQAFRRRGDFLVVMLLFLFTGIALQVFLNSPPSEPRERDYIYVGSFYFFAIWVGLGVTSIAEGLNTFIKNATVRN